MPEDVRDAILMCQTITNHEGRRRQMQFVGKKMRTLDEEEVAVIQRTIDSWKGASKAETAALHALERRRDKLLADDKALTVLLAEHPELDVPAPAHPDPQRAQGAGREQAAQGLPRDLPDPQGPGQEGASRRRRR